MSELSYPVGRKVFIRRSGVYTFWRRHKFHVPRANAAAWHRSSAPGPAKVYRMLDLTVPPRLEALGKTLLDVHTYFRRAHRSRESM